MEQFDASKQPQQYSPLQNVKLPWYKSFWKVLILSVVLGIFAVVSIFGLLVYSEYQSIKNGQTSLFSDPNAVANNTGDSQQFDTQILNYAPSEDDDPYYGAEDASVVIIAFEDFQCPFCEQAAPIMQSIVEQYPEDVKFVYRDFPLDTIHPNAQQAAEAGECADEQGAFWEYHDIMYANQSYLGIESSYSTWAQQLGLNVEEFDECLVSGRYTAEVQKDLQDGALAGVRATPTFFINGTIYQGVLSESQLQTIVEDRIQP